MINGDDNFDDENDTSRQNPTEEEAPKPNHLLAIEVLATGGSVTKAAEAAGVHRSTVYNWMDQSGFNEYVEERAAEIRQEIFTETLELFRQGLATTSRILENGMNPSKIGALNAMGLKGLISQILRIRLEEPEDFDEDEDADLEDDS